MEMDINIDLNLVAPSTLFYLLVTGCTFSLLIISQACFSLNYLRQVLQLHHVNTDCLWSYHPEVGNYGTDKFPKKPAEEFN